MAAGPLCSRTAAPRIDRMFKLRAVLGGRAQLETNQPPRFGAITSELGRSKYILPACAVNDNLATPSRVERIGVSQGAGEHPTRIGETFHHSIASSGTLSNERGTPNR